MHLALDHLTVGDAYPWEIAELASTCGLQGCCVFLESMSVLPNMPEYSLINDRSQRARMRRALNDSGVSLDLVYPFTMTGRSRASDFEAGLETAAELSACAVNLLVYDRQPERAVQSVLLFAEQAGAYGLAVALEFYPASAVSSLKQAVALIKSIPTSNVGINIDVLHLYRSGGCISEVAAAGPLIRFAQVADGRIEAPEDPVFEAAEARMDPGEGEFDLSRFVAALPPVKISLEVPSTRRLGRANIERVCEVSHRFRQVVFEALR